MSTEVKLTTRNALRVLRPGPFRRYIIGSAISDTGTWMQVMADGWIFSFRHFDQRMGHGLRIFCERAFICRPNRCDSFIAAATAWNGRGRRKARQRNQGRLSLHRERQTESRDGHANRDAIAVYLSNHHRDDAALRSPRATSWSGSAWISDGCFRRGLRRWFAFPDRITARETHSANDDVRDGCDRRDTRNVARAYVLCSDGADDHQLVRPGNIPRARQHHCARAGAGLLARASLGGLHVELCWAHANRRTWRDQPFRFHRNANSIDDCGDRLWRNHAIDSCSSPAAMLRAGAKRSGTS